MESNWKTSKIAVWLRYFAIYRELGYIPWHKPKGESAPVDEESPKEAKKRRRKKRTRAHKPGVYMGARENIPFLNEDSKRTIIQLILRPGYMMRDYILRGRYEHYLAPLTALIVFYTVFSLALAVVKPEALRDSVGDSLYRSLREVTVVPADSAAVATDSADTAAVATDSADSSGTIHLDLDDEGNVQVSEKYRRKLKGALDFLSSAFLMTRLDLYPEAVDAPWKQSLAALEGDLRSKGIPLFLDNFIFLWLAMAVLLRKRNISFSGAAAAAAYFLCQYCLFMFLALLISWGSNAELGLLLTGLLLFIDYRQLLGIGNKKAFWLTIKTGLYMILFRVLAYSFLGTVMVIVAFVQAA